ncbi:patatin-like phospholipase family protein [Bacteriovorax sp. PP10]|uniref:Patatin-like phospholipase family protein n=1 Tax=Bacteriovorax antarcticus TaxID=3088717 RepID=A0ABU5VU51_9BACT|nr:patatin-like phospholipase family protein [Bacteriovorax sp. PP10]MEA9355889.1 patatin-like phospholipase family protein [Bacteriovorax sp. PP10]
MRDKLALVLNGGGARACYQAGAVRALYEIIKKDQNLFDIITGNSAGAINATFLSSAARDWGSATQYLSDFWQRIYPEDVFDMDHFTMTKLGTSWLKDTIFKSTNIGNFNSILNTAPLKKLLSREIDFGEIRLLIESKLLSSVALSTTNYYSGSSVVFFDGDKKIPLWSKPSRFAIRGELGVDHVMGSSAIPLFFPPAKINESYYGDGCIRQTTPLSPAIHLGATKIIAIGIRSPRSMNQIIEMSLTPNAMPQISQIGGVMMNAIFLDSLEADLEMLEKMNLLVKIMGEKSPRKNIPILSLIPSRDLGEMTAKLDEKMPTLLRYFLKSIGITGRSGLDLLSYLAFDSSYTQQVVELGYEDTMKRKKEILIFVDT